MQRLYGLEIGKPSLKALASDTVPFISTFDCALTPASRVGEQLGFDNDMMLIGIWRILAQARLAVYVISPNLKDAVEVASAMIASDNRQE